MVFEFSKNFRNEGMDRTQSRIYRNGNLIAAWQRLQLDDGNY